MCQVLISWTWVEKTLFRSVVLLMASVFSMQSEEGELYIYSNTCDSCVQTCTQHCLCQCSPGVYNLVSLSMYPRYRTGTNSTPKQRVMIVGDITASFMRFGTCKTSITFILNCLIVFCLVYHALYLEDLTVLELTEKIANLYNVPSQQICRVYRQGPTGIHVLVSDEVRGQKVQSIPEITDLLGTVGYITMSKE